MGGIYAREEGQPEPVWKAIYHQYLPVGVEQDAPPSRADLGSAAVPWAALSLADKLDTVTGLLHAGERTTGSRDPFGLRRQMHGIVRILMDLPELAGIEREIAVGPLADRARGSFEASAAVAEQVASLAVERVRFALEQRGFAVTIVRAVASGADVAPLRARRLAEALQRMRTSEDFQALAVLFKRVKNIAKELADVPALDREALTEPAERTLLDALDAKRSTIDAAAAAADYTRAFTEIAALRPAVDRFFTEVFVMADDVRVRTARLTLMANLRDLILTLADISEIVPQTE
jgi:glycyl-tRNA synthetase beta chain